MSNERKFAVLIDADNVSDKYIKLILDEVSNDGIATYKRIYGDWTKPALGAWKSVLLENSISPIQQYGYTSGKNATDSAMIIDAMDILYSGNVDGFCIVSSDSDFTRLASRLRESGMYVVGMGEKKTPSAFIAACNKFKYVDVLAASNEVKQESGPVSEAAQGEMTSKELIGKAIMTIVQENSDEDGWIFTGDIGNLLIKRYPDFDVRNYGFKKLTPFIRSFNLFAIKEVQPDDSNSKLVYVKIK
ncbi:MAG: NYN domain-containing protein [Clostridiales bacterium]|nr:NYN domain-containing protein [Clostridiales bacterium]